MIETPNVIRIQSKNLTLEVCHGPIPDVCRLLRFDGLKEPELPDTKGNDEEFEGWIGAYREADPVCAEFLIRDSRE